MNKLLWQPSESTISKARITDFINYVNRKFGKKFGSYKELYNWSVEEIPDFWGAVWDYLEIISSKKYDSVIDDLKKFPGAIWFPGARLNFAENLLRYRDERTAFIFIGESQKRETITYAELYKKVARLAHSLKQLGVMPGDRVVGYMPNMIETAMAMLAATSIGAVWSSCATDIGPGAALDRFGQVEPKVLFTVNGYYYKNKAFNTLANVTELVKGLPSLKKVIIKTYLDESGDISGIPNSIWFEDFMTGDDSPLVFEQLPPDQPIYIMFSSGTTGKPKCMVQGAAGVLINQFKELALQSDLRRDDVISYITTASWMMWNWLICSLAVGATIVLYDGNPAYPDQDRMWKLIQDEKITIFGCSASYINMLKMGGSQPGKNYDLSSLREISQTGSPLSAEGFEYVYSEIKSDLHFNSIAGGTDINGCFCIGSPINPVYAGELQAAGLGMKINVYDEQAKPIEDREGELVCEAPAPPMPLYFWNDKDNAKYLDTYFNYYNFYAKKNVWRHGDYVVKHSQTGGYTFYGRSDSVLKPSGVRIGTAEIYNQIDKIKEVADSVVVGQNFQGDQRLLLFVKMASGAVLNDELKKRINTTLRVNASPRHVPAKIIEVPDIPYTFSMKKVESAITNIVNGRPVTNRDSLSNPHSLDFYEQLDDIKS